MAEEREPESSEPTLLSDEPGQFLSDEREHLRTHRLHGVIGEGLSN